MLIGLMGYKGSGKDKTASMLKNILQPEHRTFAFADRMKHELSIIFDLPLNLFHDPVLKNNPITITNLDLERVQNKFNELYSKYNGKILPFIRLLKNHNHLVEVKNGKLKRFFGAKPSRYDLTITIRELMQLYGTDFIQEQFGKYHWVKGAPTENAIITDVRFMHEVNHVKNNRGIIVKILNLQQLELHMNDLKDVVDRQQNHQSEMLFSIYKDQDYVIINQGSDVRELVKEVYNFVHELEQDGIYAQ